MHFSRRNFLKATCGIALCGPFFNKNLFALDQSGEQILGSSLSKIWKHTTLNKTIIFDALQRKFVLQKGEDLQVRNDLLTNKILPLSKQPKSLLYFGHITDIHIVDEESPARLAVADKILEGLDISSSAFHMQEDVVLSSTDAMIRTLNKISLESPFDFVLNTGDAIDNAHEIELNWFVDTLNGHLVDPDSGQNDDPVPGPNNDGNDPFQAEGLLSNIPFYAAIGNHDVLYQGNIPISLREVFNALVEPVIKELSIPDPVGNYSNGVIIPKAEPQKLEELKPGNTVADPYRRGIEGVDFIRGYVKATKNREVFGFPKNLYNEEFAYYSTKPKAGVPLRLIVLDTTSRMGTAFGVIEKKQFEDFLIPELEDAKKANELVIVVSHHPSESIMTFGKAKQKMLGTTEKNAELHNALGKFSDRLQQRSETIEQNTFTQTLASYPNVFLHIVGHQHDNKITTIGDEKRGYWEVQTCSLIEFPQQSRLFEVVYEGNNIGAVHTCVMDYESSKNPLASKSREWAFEDKKSHRTGGEHRNTILRFTIPEEIAKKIEKI